MTKKIISPRLGFTSTFLDKLKPQDKPYEVTDSGFKGLRIKVSTTGSKIFLTTIYFQGKRHIITLGHYPKDKNRTSKTKKEISLTDARTLLSKKKAEAKKGTFQTDKVKKAEEDAYALEKEKQEKADSITVGDRVDEFERLIINNRRSPKAPRKVINAYIYGKGKYIPEVILADIPMKDLTKNDIRLLILDINKKGASMARETFSIIKQFMKWAVRQEYADSALIVQKDLEDWGIFPTTKNDYPLDIDSEGQPVVGLPGIIKFFQIIDNESKQPIKLAFKLLLLLGTRSRELRLAKKSDVDINNKTWFIPKENTKTFNIKKPQNDTSITIPLSNYAVELFIELMDLSDDDNVITLKADILSKNMKRLVKKHDLPYVTPHTLRKTFRSHLSGWTSYEVAEKCLNHSLAALAGVYDKSSMLDKRREAMQIWSDKIYRAVYGSESNVVPLRG